MKSAGVQVNLSMKHEHSQQELQRIADLSRGYKWVLWLDETDTVRTFDFNNISYLKSSSITQLQLSESPCDIEWLLPGRFDVLAKYRAQNESGIHFAF